MATEHPKCLDEKGKKIHFVIQMLSFHNIKQNFYFSYILLQSQFQVPKVDEWLIQEIL